MRQRGWFGLVALLVPATPALAQSVSAPGPMPGPTFGGTGTADRPRPEYAPIGGRIGSFFVYPEFGIEEESTDNVLATAENRRSDLETVLSSRLSLRSAFSRHLLDLSAHYGRSIHASLPGEDVSRYGAQADGRYDLGADARIALAASTERDAEPRTSFNSPAGAAKPSRFTRSRITLSAQRDAGSLTLGLSGSVTGLRFSDVAFADGRHLSQRYRDNTGYSASLLVSHEFRPGIRALARASFDRIDYTLPAGDPRQPGGLNRDLRGVRIEAGLRFELTSLLTGEARVGYLRRGYSSSTLRDTAGPSFGADLQWNVTRLSSLRFSADRRVDEAASATIAGNRVTEFGLAADHEYRRNLILSGRVSHQTIAPLGPAPSSHEIRAEAGARILLSRRISFRLNYRFADRRSASADHAYRENRISIATLMTF